MNACICIDTKMPYCRPQICTASHSQKMKGFKNFVQFTSTLRCHIAALKIARPHTIRQSRAFSSSVQYTSNLRCRIATNLHGLTQSDNQGPSQLLFSTHQHSDAIRSLAHLKRLFKTFGIYILHRSYASPLRCHQAISTIKEPLQILLKIQIATATAISQILAG